MKPCELPIYGGDPENVEVSGGYVSTGGGGYDDTQYLKGITGARKGVIQTADAIQDAATDASEKLTKTIMLSKEAAEIVIDENRRDPSGLYRAGIITVAGLGGVVAGFRRGRVSKALYASFGMATASAILYPKQAGDIGKQVFSRFDQAVVPTMKETWEDFWVRAHKAAEENKKRDGIGSTKDSKINQLFSDGKEKIGGLFRSSGKDTVKYIETEGASSTEEVQKDYGMSSKKDQEMYSTRKS